MSQLEAFLKSCEQGEIESRGEFSIDVGKALEKLAAYQLPFDYAWVLKIVQAAVVTGSRSLGIQQTSTDTIFRFSLPWHLDTIQEAFHRPPGSDQGLAHLLSGLWAASLNNGRPFLLNSDLDSDESLIWTGCEFQRRPRTDLKGSSLVVSHRQLSEGEPYPIIGLFTASKVNASIGKVLREKACFCPIPITIDSRKLEADSYPEHKHANHHFFDCGWAEGKIAPMKTPPAVAAYVRNEIAGEGKLPADHSDSFFLLSVNLGSRTLSLDESSSSKRELYWSLRPQQQKSRVAWVLDGVVVQEDLIPLKENWISALLVVNAKGLDTDLSGFSLLESEQLEQRKREACHLVSTSLEHTEAPSFQEIYGQIIPGSNVVGGVASALLGLAAGAAPAFLLGPACLLITVPAGGMGGLAAFIKKNETIQALPIRALARNHYRTFRKCWLIAYGNKQPS